MSVINKMLRDLDSRHAVRMPGRNLRASPGAKVDLISGTVPLGEGASSRTAGFTRRGSWLMFGMVLLLVMAGVIAGWLRWGGAVNTSVVTPGFSSPTVAQPVLGSVAAPLVAVSAPAVAQLAMSAAMLAASVPVLKPAVASKSLDTKVVLPASATLLPVLSQVPPKVASSTSVAAARPADPASQQALLLPKPPAPLAKTVTPSATDVLAQAQAQWSASDQTGALALVQDAIAHLEQSPSADNAALAALAREHTRMSLAMGYPQAALATLVRLESQLTSVPDIWALRGNINQRLGQHPRAVQAYLTGLSQRPNEPRWMLGAAVSLAIQGQTGPAAEWTEKARLAGGLRPDVANYLRQLGVDIRAD